MPRQGWLAEAARATGYPVTEVDGWQTRGSTQFTPRGVLWHHTAGAATGDMPSLNILVNGRSDLAGPLSQYGLGRSGRIYVVAAGRANHAGTGGWNGLTGNGSVVGIEAEHTGRTSDPWPAPQLDAYRKLSAQILTRLGSPVDLMCGHKEWAPTRKIDPISLNMASERTRVWLLMEGDMMAWTKPGDPVNDLADARAVFNYQGPAVFSGPDFTYDENDPRFLDERLKVIVARVVNILMVHDARIRAEEAEAGGTGGLNDAQVRQIVLETGAQQFVEKGKPVVIRGT